MANVLFMIFGILFVHELGISISGIFLFNLSIISISFITSSVLNHHSDKKRRRKHFAMLSYILRATGILLLAFAGNILFIILYYIITALLNPISFEVAIIYELGEQMEKIKMKEKSMKEREENAATRYYLGYRLFGSLGWAIMAPIAGFGISLLNKKLPLDPFTQMPVAGYRIFFIIAALIYFAASLVLGLIYEEYGKQDIQDQDFHNQENVSRGHGNGLKRFLITHSGFVVFLATMFIFHAGSTLFQTPYGVFLKEFSGGRLELVGISYFFSAIPEVPLFMVAYRLINKRGYRFTLSLSFLLEISRIILTIFIIPVGNPLLVLPLQSMNSFSLRWPSITHGISQELSPNNRATGMNLNLLVQKSGAFLGSAMGSIISSLIPAGIETYSILFMTSLVFISCNTIIFTSGSYISKRRQR